LSRARLCAWLALFATLGGCTSFPVIEANECGNAVVEEGEDCDTFPDIKGGICRAKGQINACHYDCRPNVDGSRGKCPRDMGCAADGICRPATGDLAAPVLISSEVASWISSADYDGDGRSEVLSTEPTDLLQQSRFSLHYFDTDAHLRETRTFPRVTTRPLVRHANADGADDLIFSNFGIGMLPGRRDREWVPSSFSSYQVDNAVLHVATVFDQEVDGAPAIAVLTKLNGEEGVHVPSRDSMRLFLRWQLSQPLSDLLSEPFDADLFVGSDSPCRELIFAFKSEYSVHVLDLCQPGKDPKRADVAWRSVPREQVVSLPPGVHATAPPLAADVDGDGHLDLLLASDQGAHVAYSDGSKLDSVAKQLQILVRQQIHGELTTVETSMFQPLAAGDITGDGVADFVMSGGVIGSWRSATDGAVVYDSVFIHRGEPWTMARVVDLNQNGLADVVAATVGAPGISFLNGTERPFPVGAQLSTRGAVRFFTTGDFDGDSVTDIAFADDGLGNAAPGSVNIAYGVANAAPLAPVRIAELGGITQLGRQPQGGLDDLFASSTEKISGRARTKLTIFDGDGSRLPFAPYALVTFPNDGNLEEYVAPAMLAGSFTAPGSTDIVAMGTQNVVEDGWTQWLVPDIAAGEVSPQLLAEPSQRDIQPYVMTPGPIRLTVAGIAVDTDNDDLDEAAWLMPEGPSGCALVLYDVDASHSAVNRRFKLSFGELCAAPDLQATDLDHDGSQDLLLLLDKSPGASLQVLWNDGHGGFSLKDRSLVQDPSRRGVRSFSLFPRPRNPNEPRRLAFVTQASLYVATPHAESREIDVAQQVKAFRDAHSVVVTDPNGDSFDDIVVADADGLWLLQAELR